MAWRSGSISRTLLSNARRSPISRSSTSLPRSGAGVRPTPATLFGNQTAPSGRLFSSTILRNAGALGCAQSLLPLHSIAAAARLTSHLSVEARACCELSQGTFSRTCPDR